MRPESLRLHAQFMQQRPACAAPAISSVWCVGTSRLFGRIRVGSLLIHGLCTAAFHLAGPAAGIPSPPSSPPRASFGSRRVGQTGMRFDPVIAFSRFAGYIFRISGRHGGGIPRCGAAKRFGYNTCPLDGGSNRPGSCLTRRATPASPPASRLRAGRGKHRGSSLCASGPDQGYRVERYRRLSAPTTANDWQTMTKAVAGNPKVPAISRDLPHIEEASR